MRHSDSDAIRHLARELAEHSALASRTADAVSDVFAAIVETCRTAVSNGRKLLFFGNGGSAADAQHFATELVVRYQQNRVAIRAVALTTDTSALTAIANDFGYGDVFARQIEALCSPGDVAIGISTSGQSENVIRGIRAARANGAVTVAFTGHDGGRLREYADFTLVVPSTITARIQEMHLVLGHALCASLEEHVQTATPVARTATRP